MKEKKKNEDRLLKDKKLIKMKGVNIRKEEINERKFVKNKRKMKNE